jgi:hypothetical protein
MRNDIRHTSLKAGEACIPSVVVYVTGPDSGEEKDESEEEPEPEPESESSKVA